MKSLIDSLVNPIIEETIELPIDIGDTILMGRFKNKKVVVKDIDYNEKGDLLINGRPALKFRMVKKVNEAPRKPRKKGQHRGSSSHSDLYTDENPKGTIKGLKFATVKDAKASVSKIKGSGKKHAHKIQAAVAMEQRAREMGKSSEAAIYRAYINKMKKKTKAKNEEFGAPAGTLPSPSRKGVKKMKRKGNTSVPYGSGYKKIKESLDLYTKKFVYSIVDNGDNTTFLKEEKKLKLNIPGDIKKIHKLFKKSGKKLFVVGGAVRDAILGKSPKDFDLATDAKPDEVLAIAKKGGLKTVEVGKQFGVVIVGGHEIATFRKDIGKGRRPSAVDYTDIEGDVKRRDLTINALFYDIDRKDIVDLVGGIADLKKRKIRTVGKASDRFDEDPLRKMRALRFHGALGGKMSKDTKQALMDNPSLKGISGERIRDEFVKSIKKAKSTKNYLQKTDELKFTDQILPGLKVSKPYIDENDHILLLAWILRKNDANSLGGKLNKLKYPRDEAQNIQFLNVLQSFKPENIFLTKKFQERTSLTDDQIIQWGKYIKKDLKKMVKFKLSVKGSDVPKDVKGKEIGKAIQKMEKDNFLNEANAVRGSKVEKFITGHNLTMKGKKYKEIEFETLGVDNSSKMIKLKIIAPKKLFGIETPVKFSTLRRGPFTKTDTGKKLKEIAVRPKPKKFRDIYDALPSDLKKRVMNLKNYDQRRDAHPEGNVLKHTIAVTNRALKTGDIDFALSALFHDIGKDSTAKIHPKKGFWTHYGHEHVSAKLVKKYRTWIRSMGGNPTDIYYIVKQHMRMKVFDKMKWHKQNKMKKFRAFDKLKKFSKMDKGGRGINEASEVKKTIAIYGGRFQPFHSGHMATYKWLKSKFNEVYITTSNIKQPPRHPLNFKEKALHMSKMGIPKNRIVNEKSPYVAVNLLKKFNSDKTAVVYAFGSKDAGRLKSGTKKDGSKSYYQDYNKNKNDLVGFEKHGYFVTAPPSGNVSGTKMRQLLGDPKIDDSERQKLFKKSFGYYDKSVYTMMTNSFKKLFETYTLSDELIEEFLLEASGTPDGNLDDGPSTYYRSLAKYKKDATDWIDSIYGGAGWKVVDYAINKNAIDPKDNVSAADDVHKRRKVGEEHYRSVDVTHLDHGEAKRSRGAINKYKAWMEEVVKPLGWEIVSWMGTEAAIDNIIGDLMITGADGDSYEVTKDTFYESINARNILTQRNKGKELLLMGGAYGHLSHPFDNKNLTFSDFKTLIINTLQGNLSSEGAVTEKTDGQNIMISWKNNKLIAARNKGHIKNFGAAALDIGGIKNMFAGRGDIEKAFVSAMFDLQIALKGLSKKQKDKIFAEGKKFMSLEVMYPKTTNVIPYNKALLQFHGTIEYDAAGTPQGEDRGSARMLAGMIKQINQDIQKTYSITQPFVANLPKVKNFSARQSYFLGKLNKLQKTYGLKNTDTLSDYHQAYWYEYIFNAGKQTDNPNVTNNVMGGLLKRWAFFDKSYKIPQIKKDLKEHPKFLEWVLSTDKNDHAKLQKKHIRDWEVLFFELGAEILKNMKDFIAANPDKAVQKMKKDLTTAIKKIKNAKDPKQMGLLKTQLDRLQALGGFDAIVPSEGITFVFKGKVYKYTGAFAPVNQILGILKFTR